MRPLIIAWRQRDDLVGLAPLGIAKFGLWQRLVLLGSPMADYPDLLVNPDHYLSIKFLAQHLQKQKWSCLDFAEFAEQSPALGRLVEAFRDIGYSPIIERASICPGVEIRSGWEDYWAQKKSKTRYTINKKAKRLAEEHGPLKMEVVSAGPEIRECLEEVSQVHAARWARQHTRTVFSDQKGRAFFGEALSGLAEEGIVRLYLLRAGSTLTAFCLSFVGQGVHYYYIPGFDQTFSKDSPGHLLLRDIIREAHEQGCRLFDFMRGDEEYKDRWANTHHHTMRLLLSQQDTWSKTGFALRRSYFSFRGWARSNPLARKLFFAIMNPLARFRKSVGD